MCRVCITAFCLAAFMLASFIQVPFFALNFITGEFVNYDYSPLFIFCFILSIAFPKNYSTFSVILFLVFGLVGFPIFAGGGGISYIFEPSFPYLLALVPLSILAFTYKKIDGFLFFPKFIINNGTPLAIIFAHLFAMFFLFITGKFNTANFVNLSFYQFAYDLVFAILAAAILSNFNKKEERIETGFHEFASH